MPVSRDDSSPNLNSLLQKLQEHGVDVSALSDSVKQRLHILSVYSPRLTEMGAARPDVIIPILRDDVLEKNYAKSDLRRDLDWRLEEMEDVEAAIRRFHRSQLIRIALRDLCDLADIQVITEELSDLADLVIESVFHLHWDSLVRQYGEPLSEESREASRMAVISLGKHGGRELNFSSDIDLMFVYNHLGATAGAGSPSIDNESFFTQLAQNICDSLGKFTPEGFLYRIDNRLRPEGEKGALAASLMAVEIYYHTYGQNWERQMLLKARPVAGDRKVGKQFIQLINPFTYRKYVDEVEIAEVLRGVDGMREKTLAKLGSMENRFNDFKNGYGGIRDVEFFVQAVQMLYGGQYPEIKLAGTLLSLQRMHESHLLHSNDYHTLSDSYRFLRRIEHRLQMVADQQVYELPKEEAGRRRLAESLGFENWASFYGRYKDSAEQVRSIYNAVFHREEWRDNLDFLIEEDEYTEEIGDLLQFYEFNDPKRAYLFLKDLGKSPDLHLQPKTSRLYKSILPRLLLNLKNSPDPDLALSNFEKLVSSFRARSALYESLSMQPTFIELLASVTSSSSFLTRLVLRDPSLMESLGRSGFLEENVTLSLLENHLSIIQKAYPAASLRDHLLRVQNAAMFRSGIRFILGLVNVEQMGANLAEIADFILQKSLAPVNERAAERHPAFAQAYAEEAAILGFGKLGGREFNVASDCDLVFLYTDSRTMDGVSSEEFYPRWAKYMVQYLEAKTPLGFLYHPDTRLRPHGSSGPESSSMQGFADYYRNRAQFWEKMALSRARFICGNPRIQDFLHDLKEEILFSAPPALENIRSILAMRRKIEDEKKNEEIKAGPGGLVDVEFIAQAILLRFGYEQSTLRSTSTYEVLRTASSLNILPRKDAVALIDSYTFLRDVENRLRIVDNVSLDSLPEREEDLEKLTKRYAQHLDVGASTTESFLESIENHTKNVRAVFNRFFEQIMKNME
ncbi:MAG: bifunctional [glutamate--ammonia ligase]-adenylyl-L-tyrosine phosphorylase/[glutamate--ammonia-ligase] adenylyltransferase [Candidatus Omnitrophica bacterium]|nr:bifunctional [glutamate--ammonia ligase]-adenylyl-L-tyrosine phosphorylase/[glutamate--ammonia-ligase] adenylyltransferase [Candidatus Omnitrophota bacterium]